MCVRGYVRVNGPRALRYSEVGKRYTNPPRYTTIKVSVETKETLDYLKRPRESYDALLRRLAEDRLLPRNINPLAGLSPEVEERLRTLEETVKEIVIRLDTLGIPVRSAALQAASRPKVSLLKRLFNKLFGRGKRAVPVPATIH